MDDGNYCELFYVFLWGRGNCVCTPVWVVFTSGFVFG